MKKILIVEDEFDVRENLSDLLESEKYVVVTAVDGQDGFKKAVDESPDLILSDLKMPKVDGIELYNMLQQNPKTAGIPFIFLTAKVEIADFRAAMSLGVDDYLTKPFKIQDVLKAVDVRLKKRENFVEELEQLRDSLLHKVPHELRTPLVGIIGFAELIEDDLENLSKAEVKHMVDKIRRSGKRLQRRIEKFLSYTEIISGESKAKTKKDLEKTTFEIDQRLIVFKLGPTIDDFDRREDISIKLEKSKILLNERYFEIILRELVENALKFSPKGTKVVVSGEKSGSYYVTKIDDCGCGMSENALKEIKALKQFNDKQYLEEGVGMGLALSQKILNVCGGFLKLESNTNVKTSVLFGIPLA